MKENRDQLLLERIVEAALAIETYVSGKAFETFSKEPKTLDAVLMQFMIIGEAANNISENLKLQHPDLPWHQIIGLRNEVAHGYFNIKPEIIWQTIQEDVPQLKKVVEKILQ